MKRKIVSERLCLVYRDTFNTSLDKVIRNINALVQEFPKHSNLRLEDDWSEEPNFVLWGDREETDKEYEKRMRRSQAAKEANRSKQKKQEAKELAELARLKKKYEQTSNNRSK